MSIRVLIADDSVLFRRIVSDALADVPEIEIAGTAADGRTALKRAATLQPDVMTLDVEMPELNGMEVLEQMRASGLTTGVIVLSSHTMRGGELTIKALQLGAFDFLTKPEGKTASQNVAHLRERLLPMIEALVRVRRQRRETPTATPSKAVAEAATPRRAAPAVSALQGKPLILIGVSTGGPVALASLIPALPRGLAAPIFIVQHMPPLFTEALAASLTAKSAIPVQEGVDGDFAQPGRAYLAPGGSHMRLARGTCGEPLIRITSDPPENNCRPAVDYLFRSAALHFPGRSIAVILTGMGSDGTVGLRLLKRGGCFSIAQDEASCVVFGMPREAIQAGVVDVVAPLDRIAATIVRAVNEVRA